MAAEDLSLRVLTYLKQKGPVNTFRLARDLHIKRADALALLRTLAKKGAVRFIGAGKVEFLKFPEEKKVSVKKKARRIAPKAAKKEAEFSQELHELRKWVKERLSLFDGMMKDVVKLEDVTKGLANGQSGVTDQLRLLRKRLDAMETAIKNLEQKNDTSSKATETLLKEYMAKVENVLSRDPLAAVKKRSKEYMETLRKKSRESLDTVKKVSQESLAKVERSSKDSLAMVKKTLSAVRSRPEEEPKVGKKKGKKRKKR